MISKIKNRFSNYLFSRWGIPSVKAEQISKAVFKKYLPRNPVMIDCGSYDGVDSIELVKILGGTVHAFEAVPNIYKRLVMRTAPFTAIKTYNLALSNKSCEETFYVSEGGSDGSSSLLMPKEHLVDHPTTVFEKAIKVKALSLDEWALENNIPYIDLLWLDMQGFEMDMLMASQHIFSNVKVIHTEVSVKETYKGVKQYAELKEWLLKEGFSVAIEAIPQGWDMGNVLFIRN
jgi:FkbM family methyltransferase